MLKNTYTEEEFKKMVKTLLTDRRQEEEHPEPEIELLRRQLDKVKPALKKLVEDLKETKEELIRLKSAQNQEEKEQQIVSLKQTLQEQKKEFEEKLLEATGQNQIPFYQQEILRLEKTLEEEKGRAAQSETGLKSLIFKHEERLKVFEKEEERLLNFEEERARLVERLADSVTLTQRQNDQIRDLREESNQWSEGKKLLEGELERTKLKLIEREEETEALKKRCSHLTEEEERLKSACTTFSKELERREEEALLLKKRVLEVETTLKESDLTLMRQEYEEKLEKLSQESKLKITNLLSEKDSALEEMRISHQAGEIFQRQEKERALAELVHLREEFARMQGERERIHEDLLSQSYAKLKELFSKNSSLLEENHGLKESLTQAQERVGKREQEAESLDSLLQNTKYKAQEKELEIRKAREHLAKKVKESAMLRDVLERQKNQLIEQQAALVNHKNEVEKLKSALHLQRIHEEKLELLGKERAQAAELLSKEWQEKYFALHQEWQKAKTQVNDLLKMKKHYEQLHSTMASLKSLLGKTGETVTQEEGLLDV
jgi:chromosome segregation ATPase